MPGTHSAKRSRKWSGQLNYYYYTHDANGNIKNSTTVAEWKGVIRLLLENLVASGKVVTAVYIFHENDDDGKGGLKSCHVHMILIYKNPLTQTAVMKDLGITRPEDCEQIKRESGAYRYLIHITDKAINEGKYIYDFSRIVVITTDKDFNLREQFIEKKKDKKKNELELLIEGWHKSVIKGDMVLRDVRREYMNNADLGASRWRTDRRRFEDDLKEYLEEMNDWYSTHNACKTTIMVTGGGGAQKTDIAQMVLAPAFADKRGVHVPAAPMGRVTYDPVGTFEGQKVSVLNEIRGASWILEGFCECLDPTHSGLTGSRYYDRPFFPEYVILTTSDNVDTFIADMFCKWLGRGTNESYRIASDRGKRLIVSERVNKDGVPVKIIPIPEANDVMEADSVWDKVWQVRRRIPILINLENGMAHIDILDYSKRNCALFCSGAYVRYADVKYSVNGPKKEAFKKAVGGAIAEYYKMNQFTITPWSVAKPQIEL